MLTGWNVYERFAVLHLDRRIFRIQNANRAVFAHDDRRFSEACRQLRGCLRFQNVLAAKLHFAVDGKAESPSFDIGDAPIERRGCAAVRKRRNERSRHQKRREQQRDDLLTESHISSPFRRDLFPPASDAAGEPHARRSDRDNREHHNRIRDSALLFLLQNASSLRKKSVLAPEERCNLRWQRQRVPGVFS